MKLKLLDRYVLSQVFLTCFACIFIFMIVWIMPEILLKTVQRTISGTYTIQTAISILVYEMPKVLNIALPVGMLLGTILTFDKLSKDSEVTIFRSSGDDVSVTDAPPLAAATGDCSIARKGRAWAFAYRGRNTVRYNIMNLFIDLEFYDVLSECFSTECNFNHIYSRRTVSHVY